MIKKSPIQRKLKKKTIQWGTADFSGFTFVSYNIIKNIYVPIKNSY